MKIDNSTSIPRLQQTDQAKSGAKVQNNSETKAQTASSTVTHLSQAATDSSQDIDGVKVNELQSAIREGHLTINAEKIADSLISSVQDLLAKKPE